MDRHRDVLGVAEDAPPADVARAFRRRALETHPDRGGSAVEFIQIQAAYQALQADLPGARTPASVTRRHQAMSSSLSLDEIRRQMIENQRRSTPLPPTSADKLYVDRGQKIVRASDSGEQRPELSEVHQGIFAGAADRPGPGS